MSVMQFIGGILIILCFLLLIIGWIVYLLQWIFCRKKKSCNKKKCICKLYCINPAISKEEELRLRKMMIEKYISDKEKEGQ